MNNRIQILLADDHQMFLDGVASILEAEEDIHIVAHAQDGAEVLHCLEKYPVHLILLDISMPNMTGIEAMRKIRKQYPDVKVIMLSMHNTQEYITQAVSSGADGYILKNTGKAELLKAIHSVFDGDTYFSREVTEKVFEAMRKGRDVIEEPALSKRETEIIKLIAQENTTKEIAKKLFISENTVETHRKNILSKLGVKNSAGLMKYALQNGILDQ